MAQAAFAPHKVMVNYDVQVHWGIDTRSILLDTVYTSRAKAQQAGREFIRSDKAREMNARSVQAYAVSR